MCFTSFFSLGIALFIYSGLVYVVPGAMDLMAPEWNREYGLLETVQHVLLVGMALFLLWNLRYRKSSLQRKIQIAVSVFLVFVFMEEVDYFLQYLDLVNEKSVNESEILGVRNLHNHNDFFRAIKFLIQTALYLSTFIVALSFSVPGKRSLYTFGFSRTASIIVVIAIVIGFLASMFIVFEDARQLQSEANELLLYACWALMAIWPAKESGLSFLKIEE